MSKYCIAVYKWIGRGWTQEIDWVKLNGEDIPKWKGELWVDFINHMDDEGWDLIEVLKISEDGMTGVISAYFKRKDW